MESDENVEAGAWLPPDAWVPPRLVELLRPARRLSMPHGVLVEGAPGSGATTAARMLASWLLCEADTVDEPACGDCRACRKGAQHPDLHRLEPAPDKREVGVEQVRELSSRLGRLAVEGRARVAVVDPADRLTEQAQNALLKTLEEPGRTTWILLTTSRPEALLPTVRSRVQRVRLGPWPEDRLRSWLGRIGPGRDPARVEWLVQRAHGRPGRALALDDPELLEADSKLGTWISSLGAPHAGTPHDLVAELVGAGTGGGEGETRVRQVLALLRDAVASALRASLARPEEAAYAHARSKPWADALDEILDAETDLDLRIPATQVLTACLVAVEGHVGARPAVPVRIPYSASRSGAARGRS